MAAVRRALLLSCGGLRCSQSWAPPCRSVTSAAGPASLRWGQKRGIRGKTKDGGMVEVRDAQDVRPMKCAPRWYTPLIVVWTQVPVDLTNLLRLAYQVQGVIGSGKLDLSIWLCSEQAMLDLNITTRKKKKPTDVLSFRLLDVRSPGSRADARRRAYFLHASNTRTPIQGPLSRDSCECCSGRRLASFARPSFVVSLSSWEKSCFARNTLSESTISLSASQCCSFMPLSTCRSSRLSLVYGRC